MGTKDLTEIAACEYTYCTHPSGDCKQADGKRPLVKAGQLLPIVKNGCTYNTCFE